MPPTKSKAPRSSASGGLGPAGGVGLEGQVLAWLAAYCLGQEQMPPAWVPSALVTAVGSQTARDVDDVGALTATGGHVLVQSKKSLGLGATPDSALGKALRQVTAQYLHGVPDGPDSGLRPLDPKRDCLVIVTDGGAPSTVRHGLVSAVDQLAALPLALPFSDVKGDESVVEAREVVLDHLRRELRDQTGAAASDTTLREVLRVLRVRVLHLDDGGSDCGTARQLLGRVLAEETRAAEALHALELICEGLARDRTYWGTRDRLAGRLGHEGFTLGPDPDRAADVLALRDRSRERVAALRDDAQIRAPEQVVRLPRAVEPLLADWTGNLALTGGAGAGKTAVALQAAHLLSSRGEDVVFLAGDALAGSAASAMTELQIRAPLADVLLGWRGAGRATLIIDGLDITRMSDPSRWLLDLVRRLAPSRWRVLATVRSYSLRYGPDWREAFRGSPADPSRRDLALGDVRHLLIEDLTGAELGPLLAASPRLASLFASWPTALTRLLHNPYNLKLAADLVTGDPDLPLDGIASRHELLSAYWGSRVTGRPDRHARHKTLVTLTSNMITSRRSRVADPASLLEAALLSALEGLLGDDVLREDPGNTWAAATSVGYSHPVLFDYAVAQLVLGKAGDPLHLLEKLAADPDLAVIARPALDFHLAAVWHGDPGRDAFWSLAVRLDADGHGHALASLAAAATALQEGLQPGDLSPLANACDRAGPMAGRSNDARRLLAQVAGVMLTSDIPAARRREAVPVIAEAAAQLAASAEEKADIDLARLAAVVLHRLKAAEALDPAAAASSVRAVRDRATAAAMRVALAAPAAAGARDLARRAAELTADAAVRDPVAYAGLTSQIASQPNLQAWGMTAVQPLLRHIPALGQAAPDETRRLVTAVWDYTVTVDGPEPLGDSLIMTLTFSKSGEADGARYETGCQFPDWLRTSPANAVSAYLDLVAANAPPWPVATADPDGGRPAVRLSHSLASAAGHNALHDMTNALAACLASLPAPGSEDGTALLPQLLNLLAGRLTNHEAWNILLTAGAGAPDGLGAAFLPLLEQGQLLTCQATFPAAAALVKAISPVLDDAAHLRLERLILAAGNDPGPTGGNARARADQLLGCLDPASIRGDVTRERLAELKAAGGPPAPPQPLLPGVGMPFRSPDISIPPDPSDGQPGEQPLAAAVTAVGDALRRRHSGDDGAELRAAFSVLAGEVSKSGPADPGEGHPGYDEARSLLCAAADELTRDPDVKPETDLGTQVLSVLLEGLPDGQSPGTEPGC